MADHVGPVWLVEEGIAEHRALLIRDAQVEAARLDWPGSLAAGQTVDAKLISRASGSSRGTLRLENGEEALVSGLPRDATEGAMIRAEITRAMIGEAGRGKRAQARPSDLSLKPAPKLAERLIASGLPVSVVHRLPGGEWDNILADAWQGEVSFAGGTLVISPTPAMTLIDIDGTLAPRALALAAIPAIARSIRLFDLAGSIGVDFPTLPDKADRRAVDTALAGALGDWRHERTAMNGFGFVQLVSRLEGPSILQRIAADPAGAAARQVLRRAGHITEPGAILLSLHPRVRAAISADWERELAVRTGRELRWHTDPALALEAGFAQAVPR